MGKGKGGKGPTEKPSPACKGSGGHFEQTDGNGVDKRGKNQTNWKICKTCRGNRVVRALRRG